MSGPITLRRREMRQYPGVSTPLTTKEHLCDVIRSFSHKDMFKKRIKHRKNVPQPWWTFPSAAADLQRGCLSARLPASCFQIKRSIWNEVVNLWNIFIDLIIIFMCVMSNNMHIFIFNRFPFLDSIKVSEERLTSIQIYISWSNNTYIHLNLVYRVVIFSACKSMQFQFVWTDCQIITVQVTTL